VPYAIPRDVVIRCGIHGQAKFRFDRDLWECVGFDGEECCTITAEEVCTLLSRKPLESDSPLLPVHWMTEKGKVTWIQVKSSSSRAG
jgi:hypothetical protein